MDRQLAERMVGAACLLAVLVLVVPAILDGNPDSGATITHPSVDEAQDPPDMRTHTILLDRAQRPDAGLQVPDPEPSPLPAPKAAPRTVSESVSTAADVAGEPGAERQVEPPAGPEAAVVTRSPSAATAPPATADGTSAGSPVVAAGSGEWIVQLGSFSKRENADRLAGDLLKKGFSASVLGGGGASGTLFRVRAGPETDRAAAEGLAARLAAAGFPGGRVGRK